MKNRGERTGLLVASGAVVIVLFTIAPLSDGGEAKKQHTKAIISPVPWDIEPNATAAPGAIAAPILDDVRATVLAEYPHIGSTIRAAHITELRTALNEARIMLPLAPVTFIDPTLTPGSTRIKAVHIEELREGIK